MRRSKAWWAMLLPIERRTVWEMLRYGNDFGSGYNLPEGYTSCALCSTPCSGSTCRDCNQTFAKAEESADKAMEQGQLQLHAYGKILHIEPIDNNVFLWSPLQRQFSMLVGDVLVKVLCSPAILYEVGTVVHVVGRQFSPFGNLSESPGYTIIADEVEGLVFPEED